MDALTKFKAEIPGVRIVEYRSETDILLVPLGDVHLGAPTCNVDKFGRVVERIKDTRAKVILMGDLMEAASKHSIGAGWVEQVNTPQDQLDCLQEVLSPIAPQILVLLDGNHEFRIWQNTGIAVSQVLAKLLGVPYGGYSCFVRLIAGQQKYVIYAQHGSSNAWYPHTKLTAAMRTAQHTDADIYLYGHTHELLSLPVPRQQLTNGDVEKAKKYFVLTGSFLEYHGSYAERANMYPIKTGACAITFRADRWDVHVEI